MLYLGNPKMVSIIPNPFCKIATTCGARGLRIEDPTRCREQLREGLALDGPALIECVVDPLEPPWPPEITRDEAEKLLSAMRRGERNTRPIGLTIGRHAIQEFSFSQSPFGIAGRVIDRLTGRKDEAGPDQAKQDEKEKEKAE